MKIKKTVTAKVIEANRENGAKTHGPHDCSANKLNPWKHGLTAKSLLLDDQEQKEFADLVAELEEEYAPKTASGRLAVQDLAMLRFNLVRAQILQRQQWKLRRHSAGIAFGMLAGECESDELSTLARTEDLKRGAQAGWECTELEIISGSNELTEKGAGASSNHKHQDLNSAVYTSKHAEQAGNGHHVLLRAKINTGIETLQRYERSLRKDSYDVMNWLEERTGTNGLSGFSSDGSNGKPE